MDKTIIIHKEDSIATVALNKPEVHNAFDEQLIEDLMKIFLELEEDESVKAIVLKGNGKSFCAGGDLNWMKRSAEFSLEENKEDAMKLAQMLYVFYTLTKPTVVMAHGNVYGGGVGLVAAADVALCTEDTKFCLSEVKLGLIPSVISPYIVRAMGVRQMRRYAQTAEAFSAEKAYHMGLVHEVAQNAEILNSQLEGVLRHVKSNAPEAMRLAKQLGDVISETSLDENMLAYTAEWIANRRASEEGKEGVEAFLNKQNASWVKEPK